jgi:hypothetical protein
MPRKQTKSARGVANSIAGGKTIKKSAATKKITPRNGSKDMRFNMSLVLLIGMLTFSVLLLLVTLNRSSSPGANAMTTSVQKVARIHKPQAKTANREIDDDALDFKLLIPGDLGEWFYETGEVKSLTDDSLSNRYLKVFIPIPGAKTNNFNKQYQNILIVRKFSQKEWVNVEKSCNGKDQSVCSAAGQRIVLGGDEASKDGVWAYVKAGNCPQSLTSKCALADKIMETFQLK